MLVVGITQVRITPFLRRLDLLAQGRHPFGPSEAADFRQTHRQCEGFRVPWFVEDRPFLVAGKHWEIIKVIVLSLLGQAPTMIPRDQRRPRFLRWRSRPTGMTPRIERCRDAGPLSILWRYSPGRHGRRGIRRSRQGNHGRTGARGYGLVCAD